MDMRTAAIPEARGPIAQLTEVLTSEAQGVPVVHHLAPRRTKAGTVDLTAATMFVGDAEKHARICNHARQLGHLIKFRNNKINLGVALEMFFRTLNHLHSMWRQKEVLTQTDLQHTGLHGFLDPKSLQEHPYKPEVDT
jgi:hypothetical protein